MGHLISAGTGLSEFKHLTVQEPSEEDDRIIRGIHDHELAQAAAAAMAAQMEAEMEAEAGAGE